MLDEYGLSRDDLMETMKDLQLIISGDKVRLAGCMCFEGQRE